jgi:very-short-patch-repair endonuclease
MAKFGATKNISPVRYPKVKLPRVATMTRNPPGWGSTEINLRSRGIRGMGNLKKPEPAGEPPAQWTGTRPEWAIYWGFMTNGMEEGKDFTFRATVPGAGAGYYSQVDFLAPDYNIAIEVQGRFWHLGQGSRKVITDIMRVNIFAQQGIQVIFIDENHALEDPRYYVQEALKGVDHSHVATGRRTNA